MGSEGPWIVITGCSKGCTAIANTTSLSNSPGPIAHSEGWMMDRVSALKQRNREEGESGGKRNMGMDFTVWEEIERSESYRVCSMYEEAAALASSVPGDDGKLVLYDVMESTGMVFVQSLKEVGRNNGFPGRMRYFVMGIDKHMEVVELYAIRLLAAVSNDVELAKSWG